MTSGRKTKARYQRWARYHAHYAVYGSVSFFEVNTGWSFLRPGVREDLRRRMRWVQDQLREERDG